MPYHYSGKELGSVLSTWTYQKSSSNHLPKRKENTCSHKGLYVNVYNSFFHNNPRLKITQIVVSLVLFKDISQSMHAYYNSETNNNKLPA